MRCHGIPLHGCNNRVFEDIAGRLGELAGVEKETHILPGVGFVSKWKTSNKLIRCSWGCREGRTAMTRLSYVKVEASNRS